MDECEAHCLPQRRQETSKVNGKTDKCNLPPGKTLLFTKQRFCKFSMRSCLMLSKIKCQKIPYLINVIGYKLLHQKIMKFIDKKVMTLSDGRINDYIK